MSYSRILELLVEEGLDEAGRQVGAASEGAASALRACRGKRPDELLAMVRTAARRTEDARRNGKEILVRSLAYEAEVRWICACMTAYLKCEGLPGIEETTEPAYLAMARARARAERVRA